VTSEVLYCGGSVACVELVSGSMSDITTAGRFNATYGRAALQIGASSAIRLRCYSGMTPQSAVDGDTFYCHYSVYFTVASFTATLWEARDSAGFGWLRLTCDSSEIVRLQYNSGTGAAPVWTTLATSAGSIAQNFQIWDFIVSINSAGTHYAAFCIGNSVLIEGFWTQALFTNIRECILASNSTSSIPISEMVMTRNMSTINCKVKEIAASALGNTNTFSSGTYTDVNEAANNDATIRSSNAAAQKFTDVFTDVTTPAGFYIPSLWMWARAKNSGVAPTNLKGVIRRSGVDYPSANMVNMGVAFANCFARWDADVVSGNWDDAKINGAEFGLESA